MRLAALILAVLLGAGCEGAVERPAQAPSGERPAPANGVSGEATVLANEASDNETAIPEAPPEDPALAGLSASRRNEYTRGYQDCRAGEYNYDAQTQGEYYRIGCMAAENLKGGEEP